MTPPGPRVKGKGSLRGLWAVVEPFGDGIGPSIWIGMNLEADKRASK